ncbi:DUF342 domain-containing protein [Acutalibacter sp. 1XD8-33]|uniref:DUF342 domain-containing protein n=1 Tax=Acutalibacter sp. 1XD8-33 TaxID=2320081 RepID=UPI000EA2C08F|nr:FapA family protein [Acutalibacter sp. 1XD8-33]RKJ40810.1 DUF342 domain-containing protein [Acutalibacter sp. 1XD8-33]
MSIKEKITAFLFGPRTKNDEPEEAVKPQISQEEPAPAAEETRGLRPSTLELPSEHPFYTLFDLRRKESGYLPPPRICLDEDGALPADVVQKENKRLETFLTSACGARLKQVNEEGRGKRSKKKQEEEGEDELPPLNALPRFFLSVDKLYAWVMVFPPARKGAELTREALYQALADEGILYGVDAGVADRLSREERKYFHLYLIARGKPAFDGKNGNIVEYFPREVERILEVDEFNQVDYTALNLINNVKQGEEICRLILPTEGEPGRTVLDQEIPARGGKEVSLPKGQNTEITEDGASLVASIAGHVEFTGRNFQVKPVLDIPEDVDFSTGDITFFGDVNIKGDVLSGFSVRARGNIHVDGVLEAGSTVEAGGDLVVVKGILGDGTTVIRSRRSVFSKYIENATIHVQENLQTDCIVNGNIYCGGEIQVVSGRGTIMGGRIWSAKKVAAKAVGAPSECRTVVVLGGQPYTYFERELLRGEMKEMESELEKLECQPNSKVKTSLLQKVQARISAVDLKLKRLESKLEEKKTDPFELDAGRLECSIAYAGTELRHENHVVRLRHEARQCVATVINGEILLM